MSEKYDLNEFLLSPDSSAFPNEMEDPTFHLKTWLEYKTGKGVEDPDTTEWDFYRSFWRDIPEEKTFVELADNSKLCVTGDWMCSVATTLRKGLSIFVKSEGLTDLFPPRARDGIGGIKTYAPILLHDLEKEEDKQAFRSFYKDGDFSLNEFIRQAYTRANLIIVPKGLNGARGINATVQDYWDLTLEHVYLPQEECGELSEYREAFGRLFDKYGRKGLFLEQWLDDEDKLIPLPEKKIKSLDDWRKLVEAMTDRIKNRRKEIDEYLNS
ncbi:hypothetical protein [Schaalia sp. lx-100]|uniref:hypothetical protein n=1 Tax=Schaalia sp. lx-100 TaxID=2899081 RepID=UPI001E595B99|nr:hypothetical protein [Schaalia sp. lx-100]MCD4557757.1 hypothetical protein [Schaalia sp. lx-100]